MKPKCEMAVTFQSPKLPPVLRVKVADSINADNTVQGEEALEQKYFIRKTPFEHFQIQNCFQNFVHDKPTLVQHWAKVSQL